MFFKILLFLILILTRFWNLNWGGGFYFHPDENNMAWAVERLSWNNLDPDFFAYGQFPLYLSFLSRQLVGGQPHLHLRFWSASFSVLTVVIGYLLAKILFKKEKHALITGLLLIFTPGLIQMSRFGTTESILTFVGFSLAYLAIKYYRSNELKYIVLAGLVGGIGMASKLNAVLFLLSIFLVVILRPKRFKRLSIWVILLLFFTLTFSPFYILRFENFWGTFTYESNVAGGVSPVFYTRQFFNTRPFIFQFLNIFPWVLGLTMFTLLLVSFGVFVLRVTGYVLQKRNFKFLDSKFYILASGFFPWFLFNSFLFAKWTRFMTPILPFLILIIVWGLEQLKMQSVKLKVLEYIFLFLLIMPGIVFMKIYFQPDIRIQACQWMNENLPDGSRIVYEGGNIVDLPKLDHQKFKTINIDFYHLDENYDQYEKLSRGIKEGDYFFSPSRRIFANHLQLAEKYPKTARFYRQLFTGHLGYQQIKTFHPLGPIGRFLLGSDLNSEETWTVFDHPTLRLWKSTENQILHN